MTQKAAGQTNQTVTPTAAPQFLLQRACACGRHTPEGGECAECRKEGEGALQRSASGTVPVPSVPPIVHDVLRSPGQSLDAATRAFMEPHFGHDFSSVRVHTGTKAAESARAVAARAYTVGQKVVFGAAQYAPQSPEGRKLIAHELAHTMQQSRMSPTAGSSLRVDDPAGAQERQAQQAAETLASPQPSMRHSHSHSHSHSRSHSGFLLQRDAGGGSKVGTGDLDVDVVLDSIKDGSPQSLQFAFEYLDQLADGRLLDTLAKLKGISGSAGSTLLDDLAGNLSQAQKINTPRMTTLIGRANKVQNPKPIRSDELTLKGRTFDCNNLSLYVPPAADKSDKNNVHIFFTALPQVSGDTRNDVLTHGLRGASEASDWILLAVPSPGDHPGVPMADPDFTTVTTADVQTCLQAIGRSKDITKIRMTAHSRGYRGLARTITGNEDPAQDIAGGPVPGPLLNMGLVERVVILDASYNNTKFALENTLTPSNPADPKSPKVRAISPDKVTYYHVVASPETKPSAAALTPGGGKKGTTYLQLASQSVCLAGMGYLRLIQDAMITQPGVSAAVNDPANAAVKAMLARMPDGTYPRGIFTSQDPAPPGKKSIPDFCSKTSFSITEIKTLMTFSNSLDLARGIQFPPNNDGIGLAAHHFFVAEIAHELTE